MCVCVHMRAHGQMHTQDSASKLGSGMGSNVSVTPPPRQYVWWVKESPDSKILKKQDLLIPHLLVIEPISLPIVLPQIYTEGLLF